MAIPTIEDADAYHTLRLNELWIDADTDTKIAALWRAHDYLRVYYKFVTGSEDSPLREEACILLALAMLSPQSVGEARGINRLKEVVEDVVQTETYYDEAPKDPYPMVSALLSPITTSSRGSGLRVLTLER